MQVLVLGAGGFIGSALVSRLLAQGHSVVAVTHRSGHVPSPPTSVLVLEIARLVRAEDWEPHLAVSWPNLAISLRNAKPKTGFWSLEAR